MICLSCKNRPGNKKEEKKIGLETGLVVKSAFFFRGLENKYTPSTQPVASVQLLCERGRRKG